MQKEVEEMSTEMTQMRTDMATSASLVTSLTQQNILLESNLKSMGSRMTEMRLIETTLRTELKSMRSKVSYLRRLVNKQKTQLQWANSLATTQQAKLVESASQITSLE